MQKNLTRVVGLFFASLVLLFTSMDYTVDAKQIIDENSSFEDIQKELEKYIINEDNKQKFDLDKAMEDGQSDFIIDIGKEFNDLSDNYAYYEDMEDFSPFAGVPVWGNWCGPGHGGGVPKDVLDSLCMGHDLCYAAKGYFNCTCDKALVAGISASYGLMKPAEKKAANAIALYFSVAPCKK
ncbi:MAG TPA: hypothetical protein VK085_08420 [Pseudogracilibacillus sp.]|nr:hypothetical protein [Pseudogracilibacillus sp.]